MDFLSSVDEPPSAPSTSAVSKKMRKASLQAQALQEQLSALSNETLVDIMMRSVSHGTGGGGGSMSWLRQRAAEAFAALPEAATAAAATAAAAVSSTIAAGSSSANTVAEAAPSGESDAKLLFEARQAQHAGEKHASGVRVGLRVFRGTPSRIEAGKVIAIPETADGDGFVVRWATGTYPNVRYTGALETLGIEALKGLKWHSPPKLPAAPATGSGGVGGSSSSWTLAFVRAMLADLERREREAVGEPGMGVMACVLLTRPVVDAIDALADSHPVLSGLDDSWSMPRLGLVHDRATDTVTLQQLLGRPVEQGGSHLLPAAVNFPASAVHVYARTAHAGGALEHLPLSERSSPMWVFLADGFHEAKRPKATGDDVHCFSLLTLHREMREPPAGDGDTAAHDAAPQVVQRVVNVFRPPTSSLLLVAWVCRERALGADVAQLIAQRLLTRIAATSPMLEDGLRHKQAGWLNARAAPRAPPVLPAAHERSHVAIELPPAVLRCLSSHLETLNEHRKTEFRYNVAIEMEIHLSPQSRLRITLRPGWLYDGHTKQAGLTYLLDAADPARPRVRWATEFVEEERAQESGTLRATLGIASDTHGSSVAALLHSAPARLDKKQCATLYLPTATPTSGLRVALLHAPMANGGTLLAPVSMKGA